jgi:hypothetical protein
VNRQAALLSFTTNCGPRWFGAKGFDTLSTAQRTGELEAVPAALMLYVNPGGPSEAGLRRRRKAEEALWSASPRSALRPRPAADRLHHRLERCRDLQLLIGPVGSKGRQQTASVAVNPEHGFG